MSFLVVRAVALVQGLVCTTSGYRSYRRPRVARALLFASIAEYAWLARRIWRHRAYDEPALAVGDTAFGVVGLVAIAATTTPEDRTSSMNWMLPFTVAGTAGLAIAMPQRDASVATAMLSVAYGGTVVSGVRAGGAQAAAGVANTVSYGGFYAAARVFARLLRRTVEETEAALGLVVERGVRLATEQERNRQHRVLHDSALQALEGLGGRWSGGDEELRARARQEAARLRRAIQGADGEGGDLLAGLEAVVDDSTGRGLRVELVTAELDRDPDPAVVSALLAATREALVNVTKHAGVARAVVRAVSDEGGVRVTVRDHGAGFDPAAVARGFGLTQSVGGRMAEVGGTVDVWSAPGRGTRVTLWGPA
jgi:signal transduction histidine kinase